MANTSTDQQGVITEDDLNDDPDASESAGAIASSGGPSSTQDASGPTQTSARKDAKGRFDENTNEMQSLRKQYSQVSQQQADAYQEQRDRIDQATKRILNMQTGPSEQEMMYRIGAAAARPNFSGVDIGGINAVKAQGMAESREAEMMKQKYLSELAEKGPESTINATNALMGKNLTQQRIVASQINSSGTQQLRGQANLPWYVTTDDSGTMVMKPGALDNLKAIEKNKLLSKFTKVRQPDGSDKVTYVGGGGGGAAPQTPQQPQAPRAGPSAPQAPAPVGGSTQQPGAPSSPGGQAPLAADPQASSYDDLFQPSTILDPKYGSLTPQTKPAYVHTAVQAFDPTYFRGYQWHPRVIGDDKIRIKQIEKGSDEQAAAAQAASSTIYNYGNALNQMDKLSDPTLRTGPSGQRISAMQNALRGVLGDGLSGQIFNDPDLQKLATGQETDKYFLQAATTGLKAIYGARVTNMDIQQRLKSLPSNNLLPAVTRMLASAQAEVAQDTVNRSKLWSAYLDHNGDPNAAKFNTWYEANFNPFGDSRLHGNLRSMQKQKNQSAPSSISPLASYYQKMGAWQRGGSKGPAPVKPAGM